MSEAPTTVHGRLLEAVHLAGYSFERAWHQLEWLLEEHRWQAVDPGYVDVNTFLATIKLPEGITADQRKQVAERIKALQPAASQRKIAGVLGVTQPTIHNDLTGDKSLSPSQIISHDDVISPVGGDKHLSPTPADGSTVAREAIVRHQAHAAREARRTAKLAILDDIDTKTVKALEGLYDVIVIDPPWPMEKIERDVRPNQVALDYPTMDEDALKQLVIPCAPDCHVWLWTTPRFLLLAGELLTCWGLRYVCPFVWHKPGGFQPVGLPQYNAEMALYARRGSPIFLDTRDFPLCFEAPRGAHSVKPEAFYAMVRRVTAGRRLDMFNRRPIEGFEGWGKEAACL